MAKVNDFDEEDVAIDTEVGEDSSQREESRHASSLEIRRRIEDILEEKRLRKELEDFYD
jgi:hypothetical protein